MQKSVFGVKIECTTPMEVAHNHNDKLVQKVYPIQIQSDFPFAGVSGKYLLEDVCVVWYLLHSQHRDKGLGNQAFQLEMILKTDKILKFITSAIKFYNAHLESDAKGQKDLMLLKNTMSLR